MKLICQNPYRILGVLANSPLKERVGNQNRLAAFAKVGKETTFSNDFIEVIGEKPIRTPESIAAANASLNLDKDQLKYALFWFIKGSSIDDIALKHLQTGNVEKAKDLFQKQETFSSLINLAVLAFAEGDINNGVPYLSRVIHDNNYRANLLDSLGIANLVISEEELSELLISELLAEIPARKLLSAASNSSDKAIISKRALEEPLSEISSAISVAKSAETKNPEAQLEAGTKLMNSTETALEQVREIAGADSPQYQMIADNLAKQILQCGINYYNNAPDEDVESPRKAMVLQGYALKIAVGKLVKDRCQDNVATLQKAVNNMPPAEVAVEARKIQEEIRTFSKLPDKIEHSITLLNNTKPLLETIKSKLGESDIFYLSVSTQIVGNALHNLIEEVNQVQDKFSRLMDAIKKYGITPQPLNNFPSEILDTEVKPVVREAWKAITLMDSFDMTSDFRVNRYTPNRNSLKATCDALKISTSSWRPTPKPTPPSLPDGNSSSNSDGLDAWIIAAIIGAVIGGIIGADNDSFIMGAFIGSIILGGFVAKITD